jgi:hypothetical protein
MDRFCVGFYMNIFLQCQQVQKGEHGGLKKETPDARKTHFFDAAPPRSSLLGLCPAVASATPAYFFRASFRISNLNWRSKTSKEHGVI